MEPQSNVNQYILVTSGRPGAVNKELLSRNKMKTIFIDLRGYCIFCLENSFELNATDDISKFSFESFKDILSYIQPNFNQNLLSAYIFTVGKTEDGSDRVSRVPPICGLCRKRTDKILMLHKQLVQLKRQISMLQKDMENVSEEIREKMKDKETTSEGVMSYSCRLEELFKQLRKENASSGTIESIKDMFSQLQGKQKHFQKKSRARSPSSPSPLSISVVAEKGPKPLTENISHVVKDDEYNQIPTKTGNGSQAKVLLFVEDHSGVPFKSGNSPIFCGDPNNRLKECEVCAKHVLVKDMYIHLKSHLGEYTFQCPNSKCNRAYLSRWSEKYFNHLKHSTECAKIASGDSGISARKQAKLCHTCGDECDILHRFGLHLKRHETTEKNFHCPVKGCEQSFTVRQSVEFHIHMEHDYVRNRKVSQSQFQQCHICNQKVNKNDFKSHLETAHSGLQDTINCPKCPCIFVDRLEYINHVVTHVKSGIGIKCDLCNSDEEFSRGYLLREHYLLQHNLGKKFLCDWDSCGYTCFTMEILRSHKFRSHQRKDFKPYKCKICVPLKEYRAKSSLVAHNIELHGAKPFQCQYCPKTFKALVHLSKHELHQHQNSKASKGYACPICDKRFYGKTLMELHLLTHSEEKKFKCSFCPKLFKQDKGKKQHEKAEHLGVVYICESCGKNFKSPHTLKNHLMTHSGGKPYCCEYCGMAFRQRNMYKNHINVHVTRGDDSTVPDCKMWKREDDTNETTTENQDGEA